MTRKQYPELDETLYRETLENGLTVLEEVCPLSARMVVNQVSMRMENERITKLIQDLKGALA